MKKEEEKRKEKRKKDTAFWIVGILICIGLSVLATVIANAMFGTVTTTGNFPEDVKDASLVCENTSLTYPIFVYNNSEKKETKITAIFHGDDPKNLSLIHSMFYKNQDSVIASEAHNHGAMNKKFATDELGADSFSATYSKSSEKMQMTLFANSSDLKNASTMKYFLLDGEGSSEIPKTKEEYKRIYEKKGFSCSISE